MELYPGMPILQLQEWAQKHGLVSYLDIPARMVQNKVQEDHSAWLWVYKQSTTPIAEVICRPTATGAANQHSAPLSFQQAAISHLQEALKNIEDAYEEERALIEMPPPQLPGLQDLWSRLLHLRAQIRNVAQPRKQTERLGHRIWVEESPPTIIYKEEAQAWCGDGRWPEIRIDIQSNPSIIRCHCTKGARGRCSLGLSAIDTILLSLCDPTRQRQHQNLEHLLSTPRWARQLELFDKNISPTTLQKGELGWRIKIPKNQGIGLEPVWCTLESNGEWKQNKIELSELFDEVGTIQSNISKIDQECIQLLCPEPEEGIKNLSAKHRQALHHMALSRLIGHTHVFIGGRSKKGVVVEEAELSIKAYIREARIVFQLRCGEKIIEPHLFESLIQNKIAGGIWVQVEDDSVLIVKLSLKKQRVIKSILQLQLPSEAQEELRKRIPKLASYIAISLTEELEGTSIPTNPNPVFRLELTSSNTLLVHVVVRPIHVSYEVGQGALKIYEYHKGDQVSGLRNLSLEINRLEKSLSLLSLDAKQREWKLSDPEKILHFVDTLKDTDQRVEWIGTSITKAKPEDLQTKISFINQRFIIEGGIIKDGEVPLQKLLVAVRENKPFVHIHGQKWLLLSTELRKNLLTLADAIQPTQQALFISQQHIPIVQNILEHAIKPTEWVEKVQKIENPIPIPSLEHIHATLRPYQQQGYEWLYRISQWAPGACLADDMGLGKTLQTLAFLSTQQGPFLIVGPTSLAINWYYETQKFCPKLTPSVYRGDLRKNILLHLLPNSLIITSYSLLVRDIDELQNVKFSVLVLDEAQAIKNPQAARTQAAQKISADFILTLTGTPVENHLSDIWSLFQVSNPGLLGSQSQFFKRFVKDNRREALAQILSPFLLRRLKTQVAADLPERIEIEDYIDLSLEERQLYTKVHLSVLSKLNFHNPEQRFQMLAALTKLRQIACHPHLVDPTFIGSSSKIERCIDLLLQMKAMNRKALIFSQFVQLLYLLRTRLQQENISFCYIDGSISVEKREEEVTVFQNEEKDCFLISLKAGGSGLNLTAASEVILLDPWWNPAVEAQAADRSHRIGQKNQVSIYRLISRNTIEASIIKLHRQKIEVAAHLLQDSDQILSLEEIQDILTSSVHE